MGKYDNAEQPDDEHKARLKLIAACDTYFYETCSPAGLGYYNGDTDIARLRSMADEYLVATAGAKSVAVTPIVLTALMMFGISTENCVVDPYQDDTTVPCTVDDVRAACTNYRSIKNT